MNALSRREEDTLLKTTKAYALKQCDNVLQEFAACAAGRTVSVAWSCRDKLNVVQDCMVRFTGPESMEEVRKEYLRLRNAQQQQNRS
jgi:COX assembly protein 1